jgi:uncharacterized protein with GYD domain
MAMYILLTKITPEICSDLKRREAVGKSWKKKVAQHCPDVKWLAHYAVLGPYDFIDVYAADNDETAAKVSMITRAEGAVTVETWPAMEWSRFIEVTGELV